MAKRLFNFSAGPAGLPDAVLKEARDNLLSLGDLGAGVMEISHRSKQFTDIITGAEMRLRQLLGISDDFDVLDVRECLYDEGRMAHLLCEWRGQPVSLFVVPDRSDREQVLEIVGHDAVIWSQDENAYVLVTEKGSVEIGALTDYVRRYTD